jgi:hypothetical protein
MKTKEQIIEVLKAFAHHVMVAEPCELDELDEEGFEIFANKLLNLSEGQETSTLTGQVSEIKTKILDGRKAMISEILDELLEFVCEAGGQDDIDNVRYWNASYFEQLNK